MKARGRRGVRAQVLLIFTAVVFHLLFLSFEIMARPRTCVRDVRRFVPLRLHPVSCALALLSNTAADVTTVSERRSIDAAAVPASSRGTLQEKPGNTRRRVSAPPPRPLCQAELPVDLQHLQQTCKRWHGTLQTERRFFPLCHLNPADLAFVTLLATTSPDGGGRSRKRRRPAVPYL